AETAWPGWRGPRGDGTSLDEAVPLKWDVAEDLAWKTRLPGSGHATPVVWEDAVFLVAARDEERVLLRLDRRTGKIDWAETVLEAPLEGKHRKNSFASSTPATDGERVYVSFLDGEKMFVAAYGFDGGKLWEARPGIFSSVHGYCSSPVLWKDKVIINGDHDGEAYLVALDKTTGKTVWKTARPNRKRSYCTPIIRTINGRNQLMLSGSICVASYDPDTGKQQWIIDGPTDQFVASLVYDGERLFMTCGFPEKHLMAIDPTGNGNVTESHVLWRSLKDPAYVPSPVVAGPFFMVVSDSGKASCWDAKRGRRHWVEKIGREHSASAVVVRGHACFLSERGVLTVIKPGKNYEEVAVNVLGEDTFASPVITHGQWLLRGSEHLFCIGAAE
ncbi:MAG: PQQ-binding-like beta-propeller repeat protein, partial [Akkermansiaceae bacterium]|nr:PQQ-binding-like beta-propeller repeat protein [Akkermansiaceae bacterium]